MAITPKLEIRQSQSLLMTPQLRQAINLLQMNNLELSELINQELANNPLLEKEDETRLNDTEQPQTIDDYDKEDDISSSEDFASDFEYADRFDDSGSDAEGYDSLENNYSWDEFNRKKNAGGEDFDFFEKRLSAKPNIYQLLSLQIETDIKNKKQQAIAYRLCEFLDAAGYFRGDIKEISERLKVGTEEIKKVLTKLKNFEPAGIFAENLSECLKLQLSGTKARDSKLQTFLDNLPLIAEKRYKELKKLCLIDDEELQQYLQEIKSLNPKPLADYDIEPAQNIIPDVFVKKDKYGIYHVELNQMSLPRVLINQHYYSEIKDQDGSKATKRYLKENLSSANFLIKALHQRAMSILKISEEIVKYQYQFFEKGIEHLKPMTLKDIAENVEMHESTVSRVVNGKYMHTPLGIFELKYFFSAAAGSYIGDDQTSVLSIKHKIKKLTDEETAEHILSDDEISELLAREGIRVARRTVAKYREAMGIGSSAERKRAKRSR